MKAPIVFLVCLLTGAFAFADDEPLDSFIKEALEEFKVPGAVVVIVEEGKPDIIKAFGVRNLASGEAVDESTRFQLASVTKTFTGALYGVALDRKEMESGQPVRKVFPLFRLHDAYATKWATEEDLLAHRSGLPAFEGGLLEMVGFTKEEILERIPQIKPATSFRDRAAYSNIGYFLAGEATAAAAGQPWFTLAKTRLLEPLKMENTGLAAEMMTNGGNVALPYVETAEGKVVETRPSYQPVLTPAGALASTGKDMAKYLHMWLDDPSEEGAVLSAEAREKLFTPVIAEEPGFAEMPPIGQQTGFSYTAGGWGIYYYQNHRVLEKGGALEGYRSIVVLVPEKRWGVVVLSNLNVTVFPEAVRAELLERKLGRSGEDLQSQIRQRSARIQEMFMPPERPADAAPSPLPLAAYVGEYENDFLGRWSVVEGSDGQLSVKAGVARFEGSLAPWNGNEFLVTWELVNTAREILDFKVEGEEALGFLFDGEFEFRRVDAR